MLIKINITIALLTILLAFASCDADVNLHSISGDVAIEPSLVIPLGGVSVNIGDLLDSAKVDGLNYGDNSSINYTIFDTLPEFVLPKIDLLKSAKSISKTLQVPFFAFPIPANTEIASQEFNEMLELGVNSDTITQRIDNVKVSDAVFSIKVSVTDLAILPSNLKFTFSFANKMIMNNGSSNIINFTPTVFNTPEDITISDFNLLFTGGAKDIPLQIKIESKTGNSPVTITPNSKVNLEFNFKQLNWTVVYGKFDLSQIPIEGKIDLNLSTLLPKSLSVEFSNPQIEITTVSNLGVKMGLNLDYLKAISSSRTQFARFNGETTMYTELNSKPSLPNDFVTNVLPTFDNEWGDIATLLSDKPDTLAYKLSAKSVKTPTPDFITPDARIKVFMKSTFPIAFNAGSNFSYSDSINNVLSNLAQEIDKFKQIDFETSKLIMDVNNSLPIKTKLKLRFVNALGQDIDTDFEKSYTINAGEVDENGNVKNGGDNLTRVIISLNKNQLSQLRNAHKVYYTVQIEGKDVNSKITFSKSNAISIKLGLFVKANLKTSFSK